MSKYRFLLIVLASVSILMSCNTFNSLRIANRIGKSSLKNKHFYETINFDFNGGHIIVEATIGNKKNASKLIFDTGAPTAISPELSKELSIKKITVSLNKSENDPLKNSFPLIDNILLGNVKFTNIGSAELEMSKIINTNCKSADGIIGSNIMKRCIWEIDYDKKKINFSDDISKFQNLETAIKINFTPAPITGTPILKIIINDTSSINLIMDTGFNGYISFNTQDKEKFLQSIDLNDKCIITSKGYNSVYGIDTTTSNYSIIRGNITIGNHNFLKLPMTFGRYQNISERKNGVIGNDFLKDFIVIIDWLENVIYLKPISKNKPKDNLITYGIKYGFENNRLIIGSIFNNSEAEKIGLQVGDEIKYFNGTEIKYLSQNEICAFNDSNEPSELDKKIKIIITRTDKEIECTLTSYLLFNNP